MMFDIALAFFAGGVFIASVFDPQSFASVAMFGTVFVIACLLAACQRKLQ